MNDINYFIPVNALYCGDKDKESHSEDVEINGLSWYIKAECTDGKIHVFCGVKVPRYSTVYTEITLNIQQDSVSTFHRFDSDTNEVHIHSFDPPKIRNSPYPIRGVKSTTRIQVESVCSPEKFIENDDISDMMLMIGDLQLQLHRVILAKSSPVFKAMLFGDFMEADSKIIHLHDKSVDLFVDFLSTIYPPFTELHSTRSRYLLPLFVEYQMTDMIEKCEKSLCASKIYTSKNRSDQNIIRTDSELEEAFDHLILATTYSMKSLQELSISFFGLLPSNLWRQHPVFDTMPDKIKCIIYAGRLDILECTPSNLEDNNNISDI